MIDSTDLETSKRHAEAKPLVVCVDDEPKVLAALRRVLRREPYEMIATGDPEKVLELVGLRPVSLVVADQRMPAMNGTHLLRIVRRNSPATLGLILSGHSSLEEIASAIHDGTVGCFIRKPWDDTDFRTAVRHLLCLNPQVRRSPARREGRRAARRAEPRRRRAILRLNCARKSSPEILAELAQFLSKPEPTLCGVAVVVENLGLLGDSISRFLSAVILKLARSSIPVALVEGSGVAKDYLQLFPEPRRVLLIGTVDSARFLPRQIESAGHVLRTAASASEAVRRMILTSFDLVLLGRILTDRKGIDLARRVLARRLEAPVVVLPEEPASEDILETIRKSPRLIDPD